MIDRINLEFFIERPLAMESNPFTIRQRDYVRSQSRARIVYKLFN